MSTSETVDFQIAKCPCGAGHVVKSVTTQDNPWSSADISYSVVCASCAPLWKASKGSLTHLGDERERTTAFQAYLKATDDVVRLMTPEIERYFSDPRFKNLAQEQREMVRLNLAPRDIRVYRLGRNAGKAFSELCYPVRNRPWLSTLAAPKGKGAELHRLLGVMDATEVAWQGKTVRSISFSDRW